MTREEAKHRLLNIERCTPIHTREDVRDFEALEMAIKALEQEPCEDAISRQAVMNCIDGYSQMIIRPNELKEYIDRLPPVNPQVSCEGAISRQATIEAFQMFRGYEANRTNAEWVDRIETIVKKLPSVKQEPKYCDRNICIQNEYNGIGCDECEVTKSQKPKTGHWIEHNHNGLSYIECSKCSSWFLRMYLTRNSYCPNCGAEMTEPQESEEV